MRPIFHFTASKGWINDPHGISFHNGEYHSFYQHVPNSTEWAPNCHWGHAVGPDLLTLRELPIAIAPGDGDDGIWTGSIVSRDGQGVAFYTSVETPKFGIGKVRIAISEDPNWEIWTKGEFLVEAPPGLDLIAFRDPFIRWDPDAWRMFLGAAGADGTAMALTYVSDNLVNWQYQGIALERSNSQRSEVWMGSLWECPQFVSVDDQELMISSIWDADNLHYAAFAAGQYDKGTFHPERWGQLTFGGVYYAPSFFRDAQGRPCLQLWMRGIRSNADSWTGAHSIPYVLHWIDGKIWPLPHPDIEKYWVEPQAAKTAGLACDILWNPDQGDIEITSAGISLLRLQGLANGEVLVTTLDENHQLPLSGELRVILDGPILEISGKGGLFAMAIEPQGSNLEISTTATVPPAIFELSR